MEFKKLSISFFVHEGPSKEPACNDELFSSKTLSFLKYEKYASKAHPRDDPASPEAGCIQISLNKFDFIKLPLATQFKATPPDKHKFSAPVNFFV